MITDFAIELARYRVIAEKAVAQVDDDGLNRIVATEANSIAMLVRHISGNLTSRFTDFLTSDGEKPWRQRDDEFVTRTYARAEVERMWAEGWQVLERALAGLSDADGERTVTLRGETLSVHSALCRALAHMGYHVGQIVLLARIVGPGDWRSISIPKAPQDD
jgi:uncharacterized damage-inducible protein DinB